MGLQTISVAVSDGRGSVAEYTFQVQAVSSASNTDPEIASQPVTIAQIDRPYQYQMIALDNDGDPIVFTLDTFPDGMSISSTGLVTWTPVSGQEGNHTVAISVDDGRGGADTQSFTLEVVVSAGNTAPTFESSSPPLQAFVNYPYQYQARVQDADGDVLGFRLDAAPSGMSVDANSGLITWTPTSADEGAASVSLVVFDGQGGETTLNFTLAVYNQTTNNAPTIQSQPTGPARVGIPYHYAIQASDADGDALTYSLVSGPTGMTVDPATGLVSWTPTADQVDDHLIILSVSDNRGGDLTQSFTLSAVPEIANRAPVIGSQARTSVQLGLQYLYIVQASDPDSDPLTYQFDVAPTGMTIDVAGRILWTPTQEQFGPNFVRLLVSDGRGGETPHEFTVSVVTQQPNRPPVILSSPSHAATVGQLYAYNLAGSDPDGDNIAWTLRQAPTGMSLTAQLGARTPTASQIGTHTVIVQLHDSQGATVEQPFEIIVRGVNLPPAITSTALTQAVSGTLYSYSVRASDPENDPLTYALTSFPAGMTIDASGTIRWTPPASGTADVTVQVSDGQGNSPTQTFRVEVSAQAVNYPPTITAASPPPVATVGEAYVYQFAAQDPNGEAVTFSFLNSPPAGMTISTSGLLQWTPSAAGDTTVTVVATDSSGARSAVTFSIVATVNNAPQITSTEVTQVTAGLPYRYDIRATDGDGDPLSYRLLSAPSGMTIDTNGRITWAPGIAQVQTQPYAVQVEVKDSHDRNLRPAELLRSCRPANRSR